MSGSLGKTFCNWRRKSRVASRSSIAKAQRKPAMPACFRISVEPGPLKAPFKTGNACLQRPCCASSMAFSAVIAGALFAGVAGLLVCADNGKLAKKEEAARTTIAILPEYSCISRWHRLLRTKERTVSSQNKNEAGGGERLPHYTWFVSQ